MRGCQPLTAEQVGRVARAFAGRMALRNRALWLLGVTTGLRIAELLSLSIGDVQGPDRRVLDAIGVHRRNTKGQVAGKIRRVYAPAQRALRAWLTQARADYGALLSWPLFCTASGKRLCERQAYRAIRKGLEGAGLTLPVMGTHTMRKTFASGTLRRLEERRAAGEPIEPLLALQQETGHARLDSLRSYVESFAETGAEAAAEMVAALERDGGL